MIHIQYRDELGNVECSFESLQEYNDFKESLARSAAEKEAKASRERAEAEEEAKLKSEAICKELTSDMKTLLRKAKNYGVSPIGFVLLMKSALSGMLGEPGDEFNKPEEAAPSDAQAPNL